MAINYVLDNILLQHICQISWCFYKLPGLTDSLGRIKFFGKFVHSPWILLGLFLNNSWIVKRIKDNRGWGWKTKLQTSFCIPFHQQNICNNKRRKRERTEFDNIYYGKNKKGVFRFTYSWWTISCALSDRRLGGVTGFKLKSCNVWSFRQTTLH